MENERKNVTYLFFPDVKKYFDTFLSKDCFIEIIFIGQSSGTIKSLYDLNKFLDIILDTSVGKSSNLTVKKVEKQ